MRILYVAEAFGGGLFEITRMLAELVHGSGHQTAIAYGVRPETPHDVRRRVDEGVELLPLPWTSRTAAAQVRAALALRRTYRAWKPDVVHLFSSFAGLHGAAAIRGVPTIHTPQGYSFTMSSERAAKRWLYVLLENLVAGRVDLVGACSLSEGEQARSLPSAREVAVIPNGITELSAGDASQPDSSLRTPATPSRPRVLAIGRPSPQRRPEAGARILAAIADIADVQWVGGGLESVGTMALRNAGIHQTGWLPRDQTLSHLSRSTVYLHWTAWDGLPLSVLEAMAHDVVVVASDIGPNREILGPRQVCRTEGEAIHLIRSILADERLQAELIEDQRARRAPYGADRMAAEWIGVYRRLIAGYTRKATVTHTTR